jgi:hypothetical protein
MKIKSLDQDIIDAFEKYVWNVEEAVRFVEMGSGKEHTGVFDILKPILEAHKKELYEGISKHMDAHREDES